VFGPNLDRSRQAKLVAKLREVQLQRLPSFGDRVLNAPTSSKKRSVRSGGDVSQRCRAPCSDHIWCTVPGGTSKWSPAAKLRSSPPITAWI